MAERFDTDEGVVTKTRDKTERKVQKPRLYKVLLHNDNYTTREFVVEILRSIFHKSETEAVAVMLHVHQQGMGVAGVYTFEVAETKTETVQSLAHEYEFPLRLTIEPEE